MSPFVLDTDMLTLFQHGNPAVVKRVQTCAPNEVALTIISVEEQLRGWYSKLRRAKKPDQLARAYQRLTDAVTFLSGLPILSFTAPAVLRYEQLRGKHRQLSKNDLRIAAIALENAATVVTRNIRDFQQISGLQIEDWSK